jgi:hypothetical protein
MPTAKTGRIIKEARLQGEHEVTTADWVRYRIGPMGKEVFVLKKSTHFPEEFHAKFPFTPEMI